ncbi:MAG: bifunctional isocitrate dehydrogenase kinase/phosphatase [Cocleimonas sp.]
MTLSAEIAIKILQGFDNHFKIFSEITSGAQQRFESADWKAERHYSRLRIQFYDKRVNETIKLLDSDFQLQPLDTKLWRVVKQDFILILQEHQQPELAETFYNSLFCRIFSREFFTNQFIFIRSAIATQYIETETPTYLAYYPAKTGFFTSIGHILKQFNLKLPFENLHRDKRHVARSICKVFKKGNRSAKLNFQYQVISALFYRNKAAYIVGKSINGHEVYPFAVAFLHNEKDGIYVDAVLVGEDAISQLFGFSYAYFMVHHPVPSAIVDFLNSLMPRRKSEGLYSAIGFQKQGKTAFYRGFLHHLDYSDDDLILAPGIPGMVMAVFTLPSYPYVFKIIRDSFAPPKDISRQQVEEKYQLVKQHDRVGRMADMLEFSQVVLPLKRFTPSLLDDLHNSCKNSIKLIKDNNGQKQLMIDHVYIERRMLPLNLELELADKEQDFERVDCLVKSYGNAIKELSAANIFPGDLLFKNFGVTRLGRVVFYDYDEIVYLTDCNFRKIPKPKNAQQLMSSEPWYSVAINDIFPEEFSRFLLANDYIRKPFMKYHADLLDADYWISIQDKISRGKYQDVFPYPIKYRLKRQLY